jgi:hypothetical protein
MKTRSERQWFPSWHYISSKITPHTTSEDGISFMIPVTVIY